MQGVKYDGEKPMMQLLPPRALVEVAKVLTFGAKKYAPGNWKRVPDLQERYTGAALRHIFATMEDEAIDEDSRLDHLAHAICCLLFKLEDKLEKSQNERAREIELDEHRPRSKPVGVGEADHQESGVRDLKHFLQYYSSLQDHRGVED